MKIGETIILGEFEQKCCEQLAKYRHSNNRSKGVSNSKIGPQSDEDTDLEGIAAEFALAKALNLWPDMSIQTRSSDKGSDEGDLIYEGMIIDVKASKYPTARLAVAPWKKPDGDLFALMIGKFPKYTFKGVIPQTEAIKSERLGTLGHGKTYLVEQKELLELQDV